MVGEETTRVSQSTYIYSRDNVEGEDGQGT